MRPQDIVILLKIIVLDGKDWQAKDLAASLYISTSEVSESLQRSHFSELVDSTKRMVRRQALLDFLVYGLRYVFPVHVGAIQRGIPTAHSLDALASLIQSREPLVWPHATGKLRGQSVVPLYPKAPDAALDDPALYELLALVDVLRVGRAREREIAVAELRKYISTPEFTL